MYWSLRLQILHQVTKNLLHNEGFLLRSWLILLLIFLHVFLIPLCLFQSCKKAEINCWRNSGISRTTKLNKAKEKLSNRLQTKKSLMCVGAGAREEGIISLHRVDRKRSVRNNFDQELFWLENRKQNKLFVRQRMLDWIVAKQAI